MPIDVVQITIQSDDCVRLAHIHLLTACVRARCKRSSEMKNEDCVLSVLTYAEASEKAINARAKSI